MTGAGAAGAATGGCAGCWMLWPEPVDGLGEAAGACEELEDCDGELESDGCEALEPEREEVLDAVRL